MWPRWQGRAWICSTLCAGGQAEGCPWGNKVTWLALKDSQGCLGDSASQECSRRRHQESGEQWLQTLEQEDDDWDEEMVGRLRGEQSLCVLRGRASTT